MLGAGVEVTDLLRGDTRALPSNTGVRPVGTDADEAGTLGVVTAAETGRGEPTDTSMFGDGLMLLGKGRGVSSRSCCSIVPGTTAGGETAPPTARLADAAAVGESGRN